MKAIQDAIEGSKLATCKIWNLWEKVCEKGLEVSKVKASPGLTAAPLTIPESATFAKTKGLDLRKYKARYNELSGIKDADALVDVTADNFDEVRVLLKKGYLQWGRTNYSGFTGGNCTYIAGITVGWLAENTKLLPEGVRVEQFNLAPGGEGHAFVVVGRASGSDPAKPATWGEEWFLIDPWYSRQRVTRPGTNAVKDPVPGGDYYDKDFLAFIFDGTIAPGPAFTAEELATLR
ncbi:hypothetical protein [Actinomadura rubrisoli]|uniref:Uncharacterized protein n=1 Tax=Actinomadura rubrisoli TaxID=2530368 RepID=A0A4R4ZNA1_9ACTN|nr:hypothetical protein [Actinomadura rubrisoli]TDD59209.1 hypothetical protein E1298_46740 [Actinomadura rubrisoli]